MFINHTSREVTAKIVYYGPGLSGKTSNLQFIFSITNENSRGKLVSIETDIERTLFFDLLPLNVGLIKGYKTRFQLYTVPGQVFYNATRKMVLKGVDGVVFVADSQTLMKQSNIDSFKNLKKNLTEYNIDLEDVPLVFQFNKRDLSHVYSVESLNENLNPDSKYDYFESIATDGKGVVETLRKISSMTLLKVKEAIYSSTQSESSDSKIIDFQFNKNKEIIKKEDLPIKKVTNDSIDNIKLETKNYTSDSHTIELDLDELEKEPFEIPDIKEFKDKSKNNDVKKTLDKAVAKSKKESSKTIEETNLNDEEIFKSEETGYLESSNDNFKITQIKKISLKGKEINLDIKDKDSKILDTLKVKISKKTKKVTIILDLE